MKSAVDHPKSIINLLRYLRLNKYNRWILVLHHLMPKIYIKGSRESDLSIAPVATVDLTSSTILRIRLIWLSNSQSDWMFEFDHLGVWWLKTLPLLNHQYMLHWLINSPNSTGRIWTLDIRIFSQMSYRYAVVPQILKNISRYNLGVASVGKFLETDWSDPNNS